MVFHTDRFKYFVALKTNIRKINIFNKIDNLLQHVSVVFSESIIEFRLFYLNEKML